MSPRTHGRPPVNRGQVVLVAALVTGIAAFALSFLLSPAYQATARLMVSERYTAARLLGREVSDFSNETLRAPETQVDLMSGRTVLESAIADGKLNVSVDDLKARTRITRVGQSNLVALVVSDTDPTVAAKSANAIALAYVGWSAGRQKATYDAAASRIEKRLGDIAKQMTQLRATTRSNTANDQAVIELQVAQQEYEKTASDLSSLRDDSASALGDAVLVEPASPGASPRVSPKPVRNGLVGLACGLVLGVFLVLAFERPDRGRTHTRRAAGAEPGSTL
jgi:uncharacterized protein involved in exopolysaccharide biosynthesis